MCLLAWAVVAVLNHWRWCRAASDRSQAGIFTSSLPKAVRRGKIEIVADAKTLAGVIRYVFEPEPPSGTAAPPSPLLSSSKLATNGTVNSALMPPAAEASAPVEPEAKDAT